MATTIRVIYVSKVGFAVAIAHLVMLLVMAALQFLARQAGHPQTPLQFWCMVSLPLFCLATTGGILTCWFNRDKALRPALVVATILFWFYAIALTRFWPAHSALALGTCLFFYCCCLSCLMLAWRTHRAYNHRIACKR